MIGEAVTRREDARVLRGETRYIDDIERPHCAHAAFVRSPHAHAAIRAIRAPDPGGGLIAVLTAQDLGDRARPFEVPALDGMELSDEPHPILARDEVRYVGQAVALVIAESRALAEDAAELVEVEYDARPAVVDAATSDHALLRWSRTAGDVAAAFAAAAHVVAGSYSLPRLVAAPIEPRGCLIEHDPERDLLTVWCSAQDTHRPLAQLAQSLDRPADAIRVIVPDVGGAFGSKGVIAPEIAAVAIAAIDLGRPMKWIEDRLENFTAAYQGRGIGADIELALSDDGRMLGIRARLLADLGAYLLPNTVIPPHTAAMLITGCYDIPCAEVTIVGARTYKVPTGPYRGAGRPDTAYVLERLVDDAARALRMDRVELRRRNLIRSFPHGTPLGLVYDSGDYERCLDLALELRDSDDLGPAEEGWIRGKGAALFVERAGGRWESAEVEVLSDGRVLVHSSASPHGQGHETTFAQIVAQRMGIVLDQVLLSFGDSATAPPGVGTFGSRSVAMAGSAIAVAIDDLIDRLRQLAARLLDVETGAVVWECGSARADGRSVSLRELAGAGVRVGRGVDALLKTSARFESELVFSSGAYAAVVEIERATGRLRVVRLAAVDDAGTVINPLLAHGQVIGGVVQGLGECLVEEAVYDEIGQARSASLMDYGLLTSADVPPIITGEVSSPTPLNPLGAKGIGEGGAIGTLPAVANAVVDAMGGAHVNPPFTAEKLWRALVAESTV
ncbi:MAG: xanthine dehydrogenase family protein molybdopterin-binding subunit [Solirubrobacteraceae bacterium]